MAIEQISTKKLTGEQIPFPLQYGEIPDECPLCHTSVDPKRIMSLHRGEPNEHGSSRLQVLFQCTKNNCESFFIGTYIFRNDDGQTYYRLTELAPRTVKEVKFSEEIENTSPTFIEVYNQALAAEATNLAQLTGIGIRKALEFLIKDFLIQQKPAEKDKIEKSFLGACIKNYVDDARLKDCAERAVWLGNDETHYMRTWQDKDIKDLKLLVRLTVSWMETIVLTEKYKQAMQNP